MVVVVLLRWVVVSSQYDGLVFIIVVQRLFVFGRSEQVKYIRSNVRNQINGRWYAAELESKVF